MIRHSSRDNSFDTIKGLLIFLVVVGHLYTKWGFVKGHGSLLSYFNAVEFSFHMPAFVLISGYFSRKSTPSLDYCRKQMKRILIPFVFFDLLAWTLYVKKLSSIFTPCWTLWFLFSLFCWKMMLFSFLTLKHPICFSLLLALLAGLTNASTFMSISRTLCFFPFFLIGYSLNESHIEKLRGLKRFIPAAVIVACFTLIIFQIKAGYNMKAVCFLDRSYQNLGIGRMKGAFFRLEAIAIGVLVTLGLIALTPTKKSIFTIWGRHSITIYIAHSFFIRELARWSRICFSAIRVPDFLALLIYFMIAAAVCCLFGNRYVQAAYDRLVCVLSQILLKETA